MRRAHIVGSRHIDIIVSMLFKAKTKLQTSVSMLITTNDNLSALRFYQKRSFDMVRLYLNAVEEARKIKPEIPLTGNDGIPIRHEIELEMKLDPARH